MLAVRGPGGLSRCSRRMPTATRTAVFPTTRKPAPPLGTRSLSVTPARAGSIAVARPARRAGPLQEAGWNGKLGKARGFHSTAPAGPVAAYDQQVESGVITNDEHQRSIVTILQNMYDDLERYQPPPIGPLPPPVKPSAWTRLMRSRLFADMADELHQANTAVIPLPPPPPGLPKGLYLYGSVGCGKSFLMDLFFAHLPEKYRTAGADGNTTSFGGKRVHFHQFMMEVHKKGHKIKTEQGVAQDWIVIAAREIAEETRVLCFDEFQVR